MSEREIWFRSYSRLMPWAVYPVHRKGWITLFLGPGLMVIVLNIMAPIIGIASMWIPVLLCTWIAAFLIVVYAHTAPE
jgi:hypothetical protein